MKAKFSEEFKTRVVKKAQKRAEGESLKFIADSENVGLSTLTRWLKEARTQAGVETPIAKRPKDWGQAERFAALMASSSLQDDELQRFCRHQGIFEHNLNTWKNEFLTNTNTPMKNTVDKKLNTKIQELEREIARKDKVIVEQAALLVLGKKISAFWEETKGN